MGLGKIVIEDIKSIGKIEIDLKGNSGWHVILGDNGSGKSTILKCISLCLLGVRNATFLNSDYSSWIRRGKKNGRCSIEVFENHNSKSKINIELGQLPQNDILWSSSRITKKNTSGLNSFFSCAFGSYRNFNSTTEQKIDQKLSAHINLFKENYSFISAIDWLKKKRFEELENIQEAEDGVLQLLLKINNSNLLPNNIRIKDVNSRGVEFVDQNNHTFNLSELSDGYRSILTLLFELLRQLELFYGIKGLEFDKNNAFQASGIVLIDEVDIHLHPSWQSKIGEWFKNTFPNIQFIVTTHSPLICQSAAGGTIWKIEHPASNVESRQMIGQDFNRLVFGNVLEAYSTEGFGFKTITQSSDSTNKKLELARLNIKFKKGTITEAEKIKFEQLGSIFPDSKAKV